MSALPFPPDFLWGAATAAYQIEGSPQADGKGESIWDRFAHTPGRITDGSTGDTACDHYRRWETDLNLLAEIGVKAYRFSVAWPRVFPEGKGRPNQHGLDFYRRLVDGLTARGIDPMATVYHWDLPQALEDAGGWRSRDTAERLADYALCLYDALPGVAYWVTQNEPMVSAFLGHGWGNHAPGRRDWREVFLAAHHILLSHGLAVRAFRQAGGRGKIGLSLNLSPCHPASDSPRDRAAARRKDALEQRFFLDAVLRGAYPEDALAALAPLTLPPFSKADLDIIAAPLDFLGVNYYTRQVVADDPDAFLPRTLRPAGPVTEMGWEIYPEGLYEILTTIAREYPKIPLMVTENGAAYPDAVAKDGTVHDPDRVHYLRAHLAQAHRAIADGVDLRGYFVWSLLDNFEWSYGYTKRFGLFYTDYRTQTRIWKDSARWYREAVRENGISEDI